MKKMFCVEGPSQAALLFALAEDVSVEFNEAILQGAGSDVENCLNRFDALASHLYDLPELEFDCQNDARRALLEHLQADAGALPHYGQAGVSAVVVNQRCVYVHYMPFWGAYMPFHLEWYAVQGGGYRSDFNFSPFAEDGLGLPLYEAFQRRFLQLDGAVGSVPMAKRSVPSGASVERAFLPVDFAAAQALLGFNEQGQGELF